jgi:cell division protein FtsI/penicillin-binding protein 2
MNNQQKMRIFSLFTLLTSCYLLIVIALYRIQLQQHDFFVSLGKQQYNTTETTYPPRAPIFDRTGTTMLAMNNEAISAFITPNNLKDKDTLIDFLHQNFPDAAQKLSHNTTRPFMYIQRELTPQELAVIKKHALPDIQFLHESSRFYPCISAAPLIGITNRENQGVLGLELKYNAHLSGTPTTYMLEKDAHSGHFHRKSIPNVQGEQGKPIITTLDTSLQFLVDQELTQCMQKFSAQAGAVVIVNPDNGEVCALAHQPSFDPNNRRSLDINKTKAFSITESYELGSIIKIFCALAALEEGVVTLEEPINCYNTRTAYIHGRKVNTARGTPAGVISFSEVIEKSNNIGIAQVAHRLGDKLYDHYKRLGFGSKTGIEFPNEQTGFINPPATWSKQSLISHTDTKLPQRSCSLHVHSALLHAMDMTCNLR